MSYRHKHIKPKIKNLQKRRKFYQLPLFWVLMLVLLISFSAFYFIFFYSKLQVSNIEVQGNENIQSTEIENIVFEDINRKVIGIPSKSILIINTKKVAKNILDKFPSIEDAEVKKKFPQTITLKIKERKPFGVFCLPAQAGGNKCFFLDKNGIIFEETLNIPQGIFVIYQEQVNNEMLAGNQILDEKTLNAIGKVQSNLKNNFQIGIKKVLVKDVLVFTTSENWQIYFDVASDIDAQIIKMNALLQTEIQPNTRKNLQYIYLQYKDRAYYK